MQEITNLFYVLTILLIVKKYYNLNLFVLFLLFLNLLTVFLCNGVLFEMSFFDDQNEYLQIAQQIRAFEFEDISRGIFDRVFLSSLFFALFPIPFIESLYSVGMINFLLYLGIFIFAHKKGLFNSKIVLYFFLLYPSLILYSSLALRDMLIFTIMFFGVYYILLHRYLVGFFILSLLVLIKFQNLLIISLSAILVLIFLKKIRPKYLLFSGIIFAVVFYQYIDYFSLEKINYYSDTFYRENKEDMVEAFMPYTSYWDLFSSAFSKAIYFFFRPLPWIESGIFQWIQFFENVIIFYIFCYIWLKNSSLKLWRVQEVKFLNLMLIISFVIYGLVIYNSGTSARYKFPFVGVYVIFSLYYIYTYKIQKLYKSINR